MELTIDHIKQYPWGKDGIKIIADNDGIVRYIRDLYFKGVIALIPCNSGIAFREMRRMWEVEKLKLILHPISDITNVIVHKGQRGGDVFRPVTIFMCPSLKFHNDKLDLLFDLQSSESIKRCPHNVVQKLFEWKFDVDDLIENNLAIDVNILTENPYK